MSSDPSNQPNDPLAGLNPENLLKQGLGDSGTAPTEPPVGSGPFLPPEVEELNALLPQFEVLELLGRGGMGAVYKARQPALDRMVAIKILPPQVGRDPAFAERFSREAKALAKLNHPHIVAVYDAGSVPLPNSDDKLYYFVMEYVDGVSLRHVIREGKLPATEALAIVPQVCEALQYAHDEGIVHRDIKPDNILLDTRGRVKIADFGLAKLLDQSPTDVTLTGTHQVMGTLRYMAPEQMTGSKTVDHRADIYSLGIVFYELLTGEVPMGRFAPPSKKVQIDVRLDEVVLRALEQEPDKRYQHASEVKTEVESLRKAEMQVGRHADGSRSSDEHPLLAGLRVISTPQGPNYVDWVAIPILIALLIYGLTSFTVMVAVPPSVEWAHLLSMVGGGMVLLATAFALHMWWFVKGRHLQSSQTPQVEVPSSPKPFHELGVGEALRELFVPEQHDRPETPAWMKWRNTAIFLGVYVGMMIFSPIKISVLVAIPLLLPMFAILGWVAWKHYGTRSGRQAMFSIACFAFVLVGLPLILVLSNPDPTLNRLYGLTGIEPGKHDVAFIQAMFLGMVLIALLSLVGYWLKLRNSRWQQTWSITSSVAVVAAILIGMGTFALNRNQPIIYTHFGDTGFLESEQGPILGDALVRKLGIPPAQRKAADGIFQKYYQEFITLERRHTRHTRDDAGHIHITITPFPDESLALVNRLHDELSGVIDQRVAPPLPEKGKIHVSLGLFRHAGEATVKAELWRDKHGLQGHEYHMKESIDWIDGSSSAGRGYSGKSPNAFPSEYRLFWIEPADSLAPADKPDAGTVSLDGEEHLAFPKSDVPTEKVVFYKIPFASPPYFTIASGKLADGYQVTEQKADSFKLQRFAPPGFNPDKNGEIPLTTGPDPTILESLKFKWKAEGRSLNSPAAPPPKGE